jgi:predicted dinucleotide-binding enzyme/DMSO/TMAO reductase YedYZ heme-binding membrane subunit
MIETAVNEKITVIGTGNYGIAIGKRLMKYGFSVNYGSRMPNYEYLKECFDPENRFSVDTIGNAWHKTDKIAFLAIPAEENNYNAFVNEISSINKTENESNKKNKVLIELSNHNEQSNSNESNAERLDSLLKTIDKNETVNVVKGFNLIDAYSMATCLEIEQKGNNEIIIPICGDSAEAKEIVALLCSKLNFKTNDIGLLKKNALYLEKLNNTTFLEWQSPSLISAGFLGFNFVWIYVHYYFFPKKPHTLIKYLYDSSILHHLNKVLGFTSLQMLAFVYFGSSLAAMYQLKYGTKYKRFPKYLDFILKSRKQFGLWAFLFASAHVLCTLFTTNPSYIPDWYQKIELKNLFQMPKLTIHAEVNLLTGIVSYIPLTLVALSSINSIANSLNWKEWQFVQTKLGIFCLSAGLTHAISMYLKIFFQRHTNNFNTLYLLTRVKLISCYFPAIVLLTRFMIAYCPPIANRVKTIRNGNQLKKKENSRMRTRLNLIEIFTNWF